MLSVDYDKIADDLYHSSKNVLDTKACLKDDITKIFRYMLEKLENSDEDFQGNYSRSNMLVILRKKPKESDGSPRFRVLYEQLSRQQCPNIENCRKRFTFIERIDKVYSFFLVKNSILNNTDLRKDIRVEARVLKKFQEKIPQARSLPKNIYSGTKKFITMKYIGPNGLEVSKWFDKKTISFQKKAIDPLVETLHLIHHTAKAFHGDIKKTNIVFDKKLEIFKFIDFESAVFMEDVTEINTDHEVTTKDDGKFFVGTSKHLIPDFMNNRFKRPMEKEEYFKYRIIQENYALGCALYEILTGKVCHHYYFNNDFLIKKKYCLKKQIDNIVNVNVLLDIVRAEFREMLSDLIQPMNNLFYESTGNPKPS